VNIADWSQQNLDTFGDYDAIVSGDRVWSSAAIHERAGRLARALVDLRLVPGDRVVLALPNGADLVVAFTAVLRSGAVAVPVFGGISGMELARICEHCTPTILMTSADLEPLICSIPAAVRRLAVGSDGRWIGFDDVVDRAALEQSVERDADDLALISYTSGTSATPKAVAYTHGNLDARCRLEALERTTATVLAVRPLNTAGARLLLWRFVHKATLVLLGAAEPRAMLSAIAGHRVTTLPLVPSIADALLAVVQTDAYDLSSLRDVTITGSHVSPSLIERLRAVLPVAPRVVYGMTEAGGGITATVPCSKPGSVGRARPGVEIRIVDEQGKEVAAGERGDVQVRTKRMSTRYYRPSADVADSVSTDGWLSTGDIGVLDADSELFLVGRRKDVIVQSGVNVYPHEIVDVIRQLDAIEDCAVVGVPHPFLGEAVVACVICRADATFDERDIFRHCQAHLDRRKAPVEVRRYFEFPKTATGKINTQEIRERLRSEQASGHDTHALADLISLSPERRPGYLLEVLRERASAILDLDDGGRGSSAGLDSDAPFGAIGFHSLHLVRFASALTRTLGRPLSPTALFSYPTLNSLARWLASELCADSPQAAPRAVLPRPVDRREPIAIMGVGCRLPGGADTPAGYWSLLRDGVDTTQMITRWDIGALSQETGARGEGRHPRRAALLDAPELFDAEFFGITPREASTIDPRHRLALEVTWEAIEHSGYDPMELSARRVSVFLGMSGSAPDGSSPSMATGRICHLLNLRGPAAVVDTSCSSSLFAVHAAVQSLRLGECDVALAGGVQVIGSPASFLGLSQLGLMASDGRCKAFDASADGFGRGEGCVMFALARLSDAEAARDRVLASIRGTAAGHDGRSSSLTAPNGRAQEEVIRAALHDAGIAANEVDYLEAHGTGTALGDPVEIEAALSALGDRDRPLIVGSAKTNLGHLEAAAGAAGLAKVVLSLQHRAIPAHLHFTRLNPVLEPLAASFVIPRATQPWAVSPRGRRIAGVTAMGMSGTNVHVVVEEAAAAASSRAPESPRPELLCISARSDEALRRQLERHAEHVRLVSTYELSDYCFTADAGRTHFAHRAAFVASTPEAMRHRLAARAHRPMATQVPAGAPPKVAFLFSGNGSQYAGMGRKLYETEPAFRRALQHCADIAQPIMSRPLLDVLFADRTGPAGLTMSDPAVAHPALFALQWALAELWRSWGIEPAVVLGHSIGEFAAACVAGVVGVEEGLRLVTSRGQLVQERAAPGRMVSLPIGEERARAAVARAGVDVSIAALNAPDRTVISGDDRAVAYVQERLEAEGVSGRRLDVRYAYHSSLMDPVLDDLERVAGRVTWLPPRVAMVSTLTGRPVTFTELSRPDYWRRHLREPVRFAAAMTVLAGDGADAFVEIGPHPALVSPGSRCVDEGAVRFAWVTSLRRDRDDREQVLEGLAQLYERGLTPDWSGVYSDRSVSRVEVPTYAFQRRHHPFYGGDARPGVSRRTRSDYGQSDGGAAEPPARPDAGPHRSTSLTDEVRQQLAAVLGQSGDKVSSALNLLDFGMDSLRVMDFLAELRRSYGVSCTPADFLARPTLRDFVDFLGARIDEASRQDPPDRAQETNGSAAPRSGCTSPLVVLNGRGARVPLFCIHPSGGQVTAYLQLRTLFGDDQPLFAIQSRALSQPQREHASLEAMAIDYATVVQGAVPAGPYQLMGWSMGGTAALAVAIELERRGAVVATVGMIDSVANDGRAQPSHPPNDMAGALIALVHDYLPRAHPTDALAAWIDELLASGLPPDQLLLRCEGCGLIPHGALTADAFEAGLALYRHHVRILRDYRPATVEAPVWNWWAEGHARAFDWSPFTRGGTRDRVVGGTHFSIVRPPYIERIASDIMGQLAVCS
jgi:acyl transferase domain-containing protein/acyl-CoA synthetase (AMP-forming)/AMP-acid ligase II/thioesterase domain-containing protein